MLAWRSNLLIPLSRERIGCDRFFKEHLIKRFNCNEVKIEVAIMFCQFTFDFFALSFFEAEGLFAIGCSLKI